MQSSRNGDVELRQRLGLGVIAVWSIYQIKPCSDVFKRGRALEGVVVVHLSRTLTLNTHTHTFRQKAGLIFALL